MKKSKVGIVIIGHRILFFVAIALYIYHFFKLNEFNLLFDTREIEFTEYDALRKSIIPYQFALMIFIIFSSIVNFKNKKLRADGRINLREYLLPEFNHSDERESTLTGKAAKASLAIIIAYTGILLFSYALLIDTFKTMPSLVIFTTASIPIVGLIAYYLSYRYYYAK